MFYFADTSIVLYLLFIWFILIIIFCIKLNSDLFFYIIISKKRFSKYNKQNHIINTLSLHSQPFRQQTNQHSLCNRFWTPKWKCHLIITIKFLRYMLLKPYPSTHLLVFLALYCPLHDISHCIIYIFLFCCLWIYYLPMILVDVCWIIVWACCQGLCWTWKKWIEFLHLSTHFL